MAGVQVLEEAPVPELTFEKAGVVLMRHRLVKAAKASAIGEQVKKVNSPCCGGWRWEGKAHKAGYGNRVVGEE